MSIEKQKGMKISFSEYIKQIEEENKILDETYTEKTLDELYKIRNILNSRLNDKNQIDSPILVINFNIDDNDGLSDDEKMEKILEIHNGFKNNVEEYKTNLKIIEGLIKNLETKYIEKSPK